MRASSARGAPRLHVDSLVRKFAIKPDSDFYAWLDSEVSHRVNYACCTTLDQFPREPLVIRRKLQVPECAE